MLGSQVTVTGARAQRLWAGNRPRLPWAVWPWTGHSASLGSDPLRRSPSPPLGVRASAAQTLRRAGLPEARRLLLCPGPAPAPSCPSRWTGTAGGQQGRGCVQSAGPTGLGAAVAAASRAGRPGPTGVYAPVLAVGLPSAPCHLTPALCRLCPPSLPGGGPGRGRLSHRLTGTQPPLGGSLRAEGAPDSDGSPPAAALGDAEQAERNDGSWPLARAAGLSLALWGSLGPRVCHQLPAPGWPEACHHPGGLGGPVGSRTPRPPPVRPGRCRA